MPSIHSIRFALARAVSASGDGAKRITKTELEAAIAAAKRDDGQLDSLELDALATGWSQIKESAEPDAQEAYRALMQSVGRDPNVFPVVEAGPLPNGLGLLPDGRYSLDWLELTKVGNNISVRDPRFVGYQSGHVNGNGELSYSRDRYSVRGKLSFVPGADFGGTLQLEGTSQDWGSPVWDYRENRNGPRVSRSNLQGAVLPANVMVERAELNAILNGDRSHLATVVLQVNREGQLFVEVPHLRVLAPVGPDGSIQFNAGRYTLTGQLGAQHVQLTAGNQRIDAKIPVGREANGPLVSAMADLGIGTEQHSLSKIPDGTYSIRARSITGDTTFQLVKLGNRASLNGLVIEPDGRIHASDHHGETSSDLTDGKVELIGDDILSLQLTKKKMYTLIGAKEETVWRGAAKLDGTVMTPEVERKEISVSGRKTTTSRAAEGAGRRDVSEVGAKVELITMSPEELYVKIPGSITSNGEMIVPIGRDGAFHASEGNGTFAVRVGGRLENGKIFIDASFDGSTLSTQSRVEGTF